MTTETNQVSNAPEQLNFQQLKAEVLTFLRAFAKNVPDNPYFEQLVKIVEQSEGPEQLQRELNRLQQELLEAIRQQRNQMLQQKNASDEPMVKKAAVITLGTLLTIAFLVPAINSLIHSLTNVNLFQEAGAAVSPDLTEYEKAVMRTDPTIGRMFRPTKAQYSAKAEALRRFVESLDPIERVILAEQDPEYAFHYMSLPAQDRQRYLDTLRYIIDQSKQSPQYMAMLPAIRTEKLTGQQPQLLPQFQNKDIVAGLFESIFGKPYVEPESPTKQQQPVATKPSQGGQDKPENTVA